MATGPERVYKVALFGVTGCGKSSIINLLTDKQVAHVSEGVEACTKRARWYQISLGEKKFRLWDTIGFNQADARDVDPLSPYEQAHALLKNIQGGVDLVLLCARKDGINASLHGLYWLLDSFFFRGRAQIALILTHFDSPDPRWWVRNLNVIADRCGMPAVQFPPHLGITAVRSEPSQPDPFYDESKRALKALLEEHATTSTLVHLNLSSDAAREEAVGSLNTHCQLSIPNASALVERLIMPKRPFHTILFGETGSGKSSVVNLLAGKTVADVSLSLTPCTLDYRSYRINTGMRQFILWDTVGFKEKHIEHSICGTAIENAARLVRELYEQGGVDLLVFCKKSGRLSDAEPSNFRLFREFLCEGEIPVAFIITNLEHEDRMEEWWETNSQELLRAFELKESAVAGHACITSLPVERLRNQELLDKSSESRQLVQAMLEDSISYGRTFTRDPGPWIMSFLRKLVGMVKVGHPTRRERINPRNLVRRCGLTEAQAQELVGLLYN